MRLAGRTSGRTLIGSSSHIRKEANKISDFTTIKTQYAPGTDASPGTWADITFGGTSGANEYRFCASGAGAGGTASASWPLYTRPGSVTAVAECWAFSADTTGVKVGTYDGSKTNSNVFKVNWDALGTYAAAPSLTAYSDTSHAAASPGTQPGAQSGSPIINGHASDTSSTSYLKGNLFDTFQTANLSAGAAGTTLAATSGTAGSVSPGAAAWLATWQSLQAATQFITARTTPTALTAANAYFSLALYTGPNQSTSTAMLPVVTWQYSYS